MCIDRINELIKSKGFKKSYVCEKLGLAHSYLNDVERGKNKISDERLEIIAEMLDTSADYLAGKTDDPKRYGRSKEYTEEEKELLGRIAALSEDNKEWLIKTLDLIEGLTNTKTLKKEKDGK